ncbi:MAG: hypothetical protein A3C36_02265 [Omnitrophica WOR_2 bacterium RIFCSPHIGHO2_02_FULL_52_10]|nr:MAG: hypothetical protein A3C36_02265 [Omnitrophica WOR_2 bacterium RIFCSPHIGHO2_02_FULL_52_10]
MTRHIIIAIILALFVLPTAWAQVPEKEYYSDGVLKVDWYSEFGDGKLSRKEYYPSGSLKSAVVYVNGKIDGNYKEYGEDGKVLVELGYKLGVENGAFREYAPGGTVLKEGNYANGKLSGPQKAYDENGNPFQEITYADGKKHGTAKIFFPNGKVKEESTYVNGELHGIVMFYKDNGSLKAESRYQRGLRQGEAAEYYPNGNLKAKMNFVDDAIDGEFVEFYENQELKKRNLIVNGEVIEREEYDEQGQLIPELSFSVNETVVPSSAAPAPVPSKAEAPAQGQRVFFLKFKDMALIGFLSAVFVMIGVFIRRILTAGKIKEAEYQRSPAVLPERDQSRKEFNPPHSESEKMYRRLVETGKSGIFMADMNGRLFYVNHAFAEIFGHKTEQEVVGASMGALFKCIDNGEKQLLKIMGEANEIHDFQFRRRLPNNEVIILSASANRIFDDQGRPAGVRGVVVDMTEKRRLE